MNSSTHAAEKVDFSGGPLASLHVSRGGVGVYPPGATFGPRHMTDYEFVWIIEGGATACYDEHRIEAPPGTVLLCRPGMTDTYEWSPKGKSVHGFFHFTFKPGPGWPPIHSWPLAHKTLRRAQTVSTLAMPGGISGVGAAHAAGLLTEM
jgi:hypothetical protein